MKKEKEENMSRSRTKKDEEKIAKKNVFDEELKKNEKIKKLKKIKKVKSFYHFLNERNNNNNNYNGPPKLDTTLSQKV